MNNTATIIDARMHKIRTDLDRFALMVVVAGSIGNAQNSDTFRHPKLADVGAYLPSGTSLQANLRDLTSDLQLDQQMAAALAALLCRAAFARDLAAAVAVADHATTGAAPLADAVRRLASLCFVARNVVDRSIFDRQGDARSAEQQHIDSLLKAVAAGGTPCLDHNGGISIPGWAERRQIGRQAAALEVSINHATQRYAAILVNASATGIGISGISHIPIGAAIVVHLLNDHRVEGRIIWTKHGHSGIALSQPLDRSILDQISRRSRGDHI